MEITFDRSFSRMATAFTTFPELRGDSKGNLFVSERRGVIVIRARYSHSLQRTIFLAKIFPTKERALMLPYDCPSLTSKKAILLLANSLHQVFLEC